MASGLAARNGGRLGLAALVAVLLLGTGLRVSYAWEGRAPVFDAQAYAAIAANLADGEGFTVGPGATQPSSNYSPGLPLLLAGIYELTGGPDERLARVVLALIASAAIWFAYAIGRRLARPGGLGEPVEPGLGGVAPGLLAAAAVAVYPALLEYGGMLMSEPLAATLLSGAVLAMLWARDGRDAGAPARVRWVLPGVLLGSLAMVRPEYLGVGVLLAVVVALGELRGGWRRALVAGGIVVAGMAVVIAPWTVRNVVALDRAVPISTGGGQVLFAGTYVPSDGDPERVGAGVIAENPELFGPGALERLRLEQILARLAAATHPGVETDRALSRMGREQLGDELRDDPLGYAGFVVAKLWRVWSVGPREIMERPGWRVFHAALVLLALGGLALLAWRRRWEALAIGVVVLSVAAIGALLVASPRRTLVLVPLLAACAGYGAAALAAQARKVGPRLVQKRSS